MRYVIGVIGLGYVGLPLALAFGRAFPESIGFDINPEKIQTLKRGIDPNREGFDSQIASSTLIFTDDPSELKRCNFLIVGVPTPIDENNQPDLEPLRRASRMIGEVIQPGTIVVFESTVYPGVTEGVCGPLIESVSGLKCGVDFRLGYSPERINPGDHEHTFEKITKVISAQDETTLEALSVVYGAVIAAGLYRAPSIAVAEAAKVIENTQRDLNIALMNELAIIFDRMGIRTTDVLEAASTKWNFLRFKPGLVGGHCIGVDPYYLTMKAQHLGYHPQVILAGRRINDGMGAFIAQRSVKLLIQAGIQPQGARLAVLGVTFKEDVIDTRNSRVPDIIRELKEFGIQWFLHDPKANPKGVEEEYGLHLGDIEEFPPLDGVIIAVPHREYRNGLVDSVIERVKRGGVVVDIKSIVNPRTLRSDLRYWSL